MLEAPPGFIPLGNGVIVAARAIIAVIQSEAQEIDPAWQARYDAEVLVYNASGEAARSFYRPNYSPVYRGTGVFNVIVSWGTLPREQSCFVDKCSLVQFMERIRVALAETTGDWQWTPKKP